MSNPYDSTSIYGRGPMNGQTSNTFDERNDTQSTNVGSIRTSRNTYRSLEDPDRNDCTFARPLQVPATTPAREGRNDFSARNISPIDVDDYPVTVPTSDNRPKRVSLSQNAFAKFGEIGRKYEINENIFSRFAVLTDCEVVVLCDDSGSMKTTVDDSPKTRWDELQEMVKIIVDICNAILPKGIDIYFLNRDPILNVTNPEQIKRAFMIPPRGLTPISPALRNIFTAKQQHTNDKKLLVLIATDGAPTNQRGEVDIDTLESILINERGKSTHITFLACTDDPDVIEYLQDWDEKLPNLDLIDDFKTEAVRVHKTCGKGFPFSYGDYVAKALLGSIIPWLDDVDGSL